MSIRRAREAVAKLRRLASPEMTAAIGKAINEGATLIEVTAEHLITAGSVSGKHHIASNPGEPPNNNRGDLVRGIEVSQPEPLMAIVSSSAPHAKPLELGTSKMEARPYLAPAVAMKRDDVARNIKAAINREIRKLGK